MTNQYYPNSIFDQDSDPRRISILYIQLLIQFTFTTLLCLEILVTALVHYEEDNSHVKAAVIDGAVIVK